jgi:hypothetical protein
MLLLPLPLLLLQRVEPAEREWISFYKPNLTVALVDHFQAYPKNAIPPQVSSTSSSITRQQHGSSDVTGQLTRVAAARSSMGSGINTLASKQFHAGWWKEQRLL